MKQFLFFIVGILFSHFSYAQEIPQLKLTPIGVEAIIVEIPNKSAQEIYEKAKNWVQETYKNPDKVLKANIVNEKIRVDGYAKDAWWYKTMGMKYSMNMSYTLDISFKEGKYKFEYIIGQFSTDSGQKALYTYSSFYNNKNEIRKVYTDAVPSLEKTMNELSLSFYNYVTGKTSQKDDW